MTKLVPVGIREEMVLRVASLIGIVARVWLQLSQKLKVAPRGAGLCSHLSEMIAMTCETAALFTEKAGACAGEQSPPEEAST